MTDRSKQGPQGRAWCRAFWRFAAALLVLLPTASLAEPQDGQKFQDWTVRCEGDPNNAANSRCFIFQSVVDTEKDRPVMMFAVSRQPDEPLARAVIVLPLGVALRPGIEMAIDNGAPQGFPFVICLPDGCQAHVPLDDAMVGSFKRGNGGSIKFRALPSGQVVTLPFSLKGFTAALNALL